MRQIKKDSRDLTSFDGAALGSARTDLGASLEREIAKEATYLAAAPNEQRLGLESRYNNPSSQLEGVQMKLWETGFNSNIDLSYVPPAIKGLRFVEARKVVEVLIDDQIKTMFIKEPGANLTTNKQDSVLEETKRYMALIEQAIQAKEIPPNLSAEDVYKLVQQNVMALRLQETAAMENALGDHGIRHLVEHNIGVCERVSEILKEQGVEQVTPLTRLMMHQTMILHDLGYAMDSVRKPINQEGLKGQDYGHNLLAAQFVRQSAGQPESPLVKVFGAEGVEMVHNAILYHDKGPSGGPEISFKAGMDQQAVLTSVVQLADNTAAFSQKLAAVLYEVPETLTYMRLLKTAHELDNNRLAEDLKVKLAEQIGEMRGLSTEDRRALQNSALMLATNGYKFSVSRLVGNEPTYDATKDPATGAIQIAIKVQENNIHQQIVTLFAVDQYEQLGKFIKNLMNQQVDISAQPDVVFVENEAVRIQVLTRSKRDMQPRDKFEEQIAFIMENPELMHYSSRDLPLALRQKNIEQPIEAWNAREKNKMTETDLRRAVSGILPEGMQTAEPEKIIAELKKLSALIREQRAELLDERIPRILGKRDVQSV